ncbi:MAG: hypothetical protein DRH30_04880 [Deltaproteobacteria bacterium]|nr:MAG: hypothetical protein DRH30_04880 [Deltaproteobacteria bacterium]
MSYSLGSATPGDAALATEAGIPVDILMAIRQIESSASPRAVRFEPHVFHRKTNSRFVSSVPGSPGEVSRVREYTNRAAFERARRYDETAAIQSTSWGLFQVLGGHLIRRYPRRPVSAFDANPEQVSKELLVSWFQGNPRAKTAAQNYDIAELARRYNGSDRWRRRVTLALERIQGEGIEIAQGSMKTALPVLGILAITGSAAVAGWAYYKYGRR